MSNLRLDKNNAMKRLREELIQSIVREAKTGFMEGVGLRQLLEDPDLLNESILPHLYGRRCESYSGRTKLKDLRTLLLGFALCCQESYIKVLNYLSLCAKDYYVCIDNGCKNFV